MISSLEQALSQRSHRAKEDLKWTRPKRDLSKPFSHKRDISGLSD